MNLSTQKDEKKLKTTSTENTPTTTGKTTMEKKEILKKYFELSLLKKMIINSNKDENQS
jgi:hypothetical protein